MNVHPNVDMQEFREKSVHLKMKSIQAWNIGLLKKERKDSNIQRRTWQEKGYVTPKLSGFLFLTPLGNLNEILSF